ncbi:MAG: hypothetical protein NW208_19000 [Bryobacter sp.]|nr:hypothetical protein [Bryobacter sp.]
MSRILAALSLARCEFDFAIELTCSVAAEVCYRAAAWSVTSFAIVWLLAATF